MPGVALGKLIQLGRRYTARRVVIIYRARSLCALALSYLEDTVVFTLQRFIFCLSCPSDISVVETRYSSNTGGESSSLTQCDYVEGVGIGIAVADPAYSITIGFLGR